MYPGIHPEIKSTTSVFVYVNRLFYRQRYVNYLFQLTFACVCRGIPEITITTSMDAPTDVKKKRKLRSSKTMTDLIFHQQNSSEVINCYPLLKVSFSNSFLYLKMILDRAKKKMLCYNLKFYVKYQNIYE